MQCIHLLALFDRGWQRGDVECECGCSTHCRCRERPSRIASTTSTSTPTFIPTSTAARYSTTTDAGAQSTRSTPGAWSMPQSRCRQVDLCPIHHHPQYLQLIFRPCVFSECFLLDRNVFLQRVQHRPRIQITMSVAHWENAQYTEDCGGIEARSHRHPLEPIERIRPFERRPKIDLGHRTVYTRLSALLKRFFPSRS